MLLTSFLTKLFTGSDIDGAVTEVAPRERAAGRRAATTKPAKYNLVSFLFTLVVCSSPWQVTCNKFVCLLGLNCMTLI